jgi:hypothetical protein
MKMISKVGLGVFLTAGLLGCDGIGGNGKLFFTDNETALFDGPVDQKFALGDTIDFKVTALSDSGVVLGAEFTSAAKDATQLSIATTTFSDNSTPDLDDDSLRVLGTTLTEGLVTLEISDAVGVVDFINFNIVPADSVLLQPIQFDVKSGKVIGDTINIFAGNDVPLVSQLNSASNGLLRGQIAATVDTEDDTAVSLVLALDAGFELGERFLNGITPFTAVSLFGPEGATNLISNVSFSDAAGSFLETITVNVVPFVEVGLVLTANTQGQDPAAPVSFGDIKASTKRANGEEVFGGEYVFVELVPDGGTALLNLFPSTTTDDKVTFSVVQAGVAQVEVSLVDNSVVGGFVVEQQIVTINVTN